MPDRHRIFSFGEWLPWSLGETDHVQQRSMTHAEFSVLVDFQTMHASHQFHVGSEAVGG